MDKTLMKRKGKYLTALETLEKENDGLITPAMVVKSAEREESPLHNYFEWDDTEAGKKFRLHQARILLTTVKIETVSDRKDEAFFNAIVTVEEKPVRGYVSRDRALTDKNIYRQVLRVAARELDYWQKKYDSIRQLQGIIDQEKLQKIKEESEY